MIFMDYSMGMMNGDVATKLVIIIISLNFKFTYQIKKLIKQNSYVKSVIIGYSDDDRLAVYENFKLSGVDFFEQKPTS